MKSKNYLGKPDENRGILMFVVLFVLVLAAVLVIHSIAKSHDIEEVVFEGDFAVAEKITADVSKLELSDSKVLVEGVLNAGLTQARIIKLRDVDLVLRANEEDKYEYNVDYHISAENIEFSSKNKDKILIDINEIESGEYTLFLRMKFESSSNELGYTYKYYSMNNAAELENIEQDGIKITFDTYQNVLNYLKIVK